VLTVTSASTTSFRAEGVHPRGDKTYVWDSTAGGLQS